MPKTIAGGRPHCRSCGVDMWLTRVVGSDGTGAGAYVFECKVCGAQTTLSAAEARESGIADRI